MILLIQFINQIVLSVGIVVIFGFLIAMLSKLLYRILGRRGRTIALISGVVGTPVHELGHAAMCLIFGHKIVKMKLYQMDDSDGMLGYVQHSYNKKNIYHQIGNFFIGVGPIIFGCLVLFLLFWLLLPSTLDVFISKVSQLSGMDFNFSNSETYKDLFSVIGSFITTLFNPSNLANIKWWVFIALAMLIALHMNLSAADIKGSVVGFIYVAILLFIFDAAVFIISKPFLNTVTTYMISFAFYAVVFMMLSIIIYLAMILLSAVIFKLILRRR